jgi:hypothetical protein
MVANSPAILPVICLSALFGVTVGSPEASAADPTTAPSELVATIEAIETAANAQDLEQVMALYANSFQGPDGFTREQYQTTLSAFWEQYDNLNYDVELLSWTPDGTGFVTETLTLVQGQKQADGRDMTLTSEMRSRQRLENGQIVSQEILAEQSRLESGTMPPSVQVQLPETVAPGEEFTFDAIVKEPLGDRLLLGLALNEGVTPEDFLTPRPLDLERLSAGGLFKVGKAPTKPDQRWISAVLVREDGIVIDTRRLRVGE